MQYCTDDRDVVGRAFKRRRAGEAGHGQEGAIISPVHMAYEPANSHGHQYGNISIYGDAPVHMGDTIIQNDIKEVENIMKSVQTQQLAAGVRQWLSAPDAIIDYNTACAKRHSGTGQWFVQSPDFTSWLQQGNSFLWLYGFAGSGKSVLCSTAIQHAFRNAWSQAKSAVAFFFFTFSDESKQDTSALLRALLLQLSEQIAGVHTDLNILKDTYQHGTPPVPILAEYLRQAMRRCRHVYLLLDALDESPEDTSRADVLSLLNTIQGWQLPGLHLLVTSRDIPDIREGLNIEARNMIALQNNDVDQDIIRYVSYQLEHDRRLKRWGPHCEIIKQYLAQRANGVFRWVECQLQPLRQCPQSKYDLKKCLEQLPRTLDETYERMLVEIAQSYCERARRILTLLCFSSRPLTVPEVVDAITVDIEADCYDLDRKLENAQDLLRICPGLIDITAYSLEEDNSLVPIMSVYRYTERPNIVRIAHFSVQEYLLSNRIMQGRAAGFAISGTTGHFQISKTCLIYLCNQDFVDQALTESLIRQYPFARFAAEFWHYHHCLVDSNSGTELKEYALTLLQTRALLERWIRLYDVDQPSRQNIYYNKQAKTYATSTYYASFLGLDHVLACILTIPAVDVNAKGGKYGNALQAASSNGHDKVVQMLLDAGANVNARGGKYGNALQAASSNGHDKVVQMLLNMGANVNAQGGDYFTALQAASSNGHEKVVQMLLDVGADANAQEGGYGTPLQAASTYCYERASPMLPYVGADFDVPRRYSTALQEASWEGFKKIVQMLLDAGADANAQEGGYGTALQAASSNGHEKVVQMLLDAGADVHAQRAEHGSALYAASVRGHEKVVQMLLDAGADVHAQGGEYSDVLYAASVRGHEKVVRILLDAGADVHAQEGKDSNVLYAASTRGYEKVVRMLLDAGADVHAQVGEYGNALHAASYNGHEKVVQILLDMGADVHAQGREYFNALQAASVRGHDEVVRVLLDRGADMNAQGGLYDNALHAASYHCHGNVMQLLLKRGAKDV